MHWSCWTIPKLFQQIWELEIVQHVLMCLSIISLVLREQAQLLKNITPCYNPPHPPNFSLGRMQSDKYCSPGNRQTQTCPSDCQTEKRDSSLQSLLEGCVCSVVHTDPCADHYMAFTILRPAYSQMLKLKQTFKSLALICYLKLLLRGFGMHQMSL